MRRIFPVHAISHLKTNFSTFCVLIRRVKKMARDVTDYSDDFCLKSCLDENVEVQRQPLFELCGLTTVHTVSPYFTISKKKYA